MIEELYLNINPLQVGGKTYADTRKEIFSWMDGYAVCDACKGTLRTTDKPPIKSFLADVSEFLGADNALLTNGAREAKYAVMHALCDPGDCIVADGNAHYSTLLAAERCGLRTMLTDVSPHPEYLVTPESYTDAIEACIDTTGQAPKLAVVTHVDGNYGNLVDAKAISRICHSYDIPVLLNTAYSSGRMPIDARGLGVDFVTCSAHKSWATGGGNAGLLAFMEPFESKVLRFSETNPIKPIENLGCSTRGSAIVALIASFPHIVERVKNWDTELSHARMIVSRLLEEGGFSLMGESPRRHDIIALETPAFDEIAKTHKKRGYFLAKELKKRGIVGIKPGRTKKFKFSSFGLTDSQADYLVESFIDIKRKYM